MQAAIRQLELTGLVTIRRGSGGGAFVTKPDFARVSSMLHTMLRGNHFEIGDLYEARLLIEPGIAEIAAERANQEDIAAMRAFVASGRADRPQRGSIGRHFHYLLARATRNNLLVMLVSSLLSVADAAPTRTRTSSVEIRHEAHERIVDAIERRDGVKARRVATEHLTQLLREVTSGASQPVKEE